MRNSITISFGAAILSVAVSGCMSGDESSERDDVIAFGVCPPQLCGVNSDLAGSISFDSKGEVENAGMRLVAAYTPSGDKVEPRVSRSELALVPANSDAIEGEDLIGARLVFESVDDGSQFFVYLEGYDKDSLVSYVKPSVTYSSYYFTYRTEDDPEDTRRPLCGDFPWAEQNIDVGSIDPVHALMIQSEAYDWRGRPVEGPIDNFDWVTLGCIGGAYAKKVLMGYDPHHPAPEDTTLAENETMLRLLTARYCPTGDFNTVPGTPIHWANDRGWLTEDPSVEVELEAIWSVDGAVCLDTPRVVDRSVVEAECEIPTCEGFDPADYHLASYRVL